MDEKKEGSTRRSCGAAVCLFAAKTEEEEKKKLLLQPTNSKTKRNSEGPQNRIGRRPLKLDHRADFVREGDGKKTDYKRDASLGS